MFPLDPLTRRTPLMAKPRTVNLADYKAKKSDEDSIDIVGASGDKHRILPMALMSDKDLALLRKASEDPLGSAVVMFGGQDAYDAFVADGGSAALAHAIFAETHGSPGE
jgi:hypothetical protein